jgi:hypothetical protein
MLDISVNRSVFQAAQESYQPSGTAPRMSRRDVLPGSQVGTLCLIGRTSI